MFCYVGKRLAPSYANISMYLLEQDFLAAFPRIPLFYVRYIDYIFMIWEHGADSLMTFFDYFNILHDSIKFTMDHSYRYCMVMFQEGPIETPVDSKPTDKLSLPIFLFSQLFHRSYSL